MRNLKLVKYLLFAGLCACIVYFVDLKGVWAAISKLTWQAFVFCLICEGLFYLVECFRLYFLAERRFTLKSLISSRLLTVFVGTFLPGAISSEVLRVFLLAKDKQASKFYILMLFLANRLYGAISLVSVLFLALIVTYPKFPFPTSPQIQILIWILCPIIVLSPLALSIKLVRRFVMFIYSKNRGRLRAVLKPLLLAILSFPKPRSWLIATSTSIISNSILVTEFWFIGSQLGLEVGFASWCIWIAFVTVASFLPIGIGAVGPQESAMLIGASVLGLEPETVLAVSLLIHAVRFAGSIPGCIWIGDIAGLGPNLKALKK